MYRSAIAFLFCTLELDRNLVQIIGLFRRNPRCSSAVLRILVNTSYWFYWIRNYYYAFTNMGMGSRSRLCSWSHVARVGQPSGCLLMSRLLTMARAPALFRKNDVVRLIQAVRAAGVSVAGIEVTPDGTLRVLETAPSQAPLSDFDRYEAEL